MVPSGEYFDGEQGTGCRDGCMLVLCGAVLVILMATLTHKLKDSSKVIQNPKTEIKNDIDKYRIDTIKIDSINAQKYNYKGYNNGR